MRLHDSTPHTSLGIGGVDTISEDIQMFTSSRSGDLQYCIVRLGSVLCVYVPLNNRGESILCAKVDSIVYFI